MRPHLTPLPILVSARAYIMKRGGESDNGEKALMKIAVGMFSNVLEGAERGNANTRTSFLLLNFLCGGVYVCYNKSKHKDTRSLKLLQ